MEDRWLLIVAGFFIHLCKKQELNWVSFVFYFVKISIQSHILKDPDCEQVKCINSILKNLN